MDPKTKTGVIIAICVVGVVLVMGVAATAFVLITHNTEDTSMNHALNKAMENQGTLSYTNGPYPSIQLNKWVHSTYYGSYNSIKVKAHINGDTLVIEVMTSSDYNPTKDTDVTQVHYYSVLDVTSIKYTEDGVTYTWHG